MADMKSITSESGDGDFATPLMSASMRQFDGHANDVMIPTVNAFTWQQHIPNARRFQSRSNTSRM
jgi:hypothetical protein